MSKWFQFSDKKNIKLRILFYIIIIFLILSCNVSASAKNAILLIGDGMGYAEITAARWEKANEDLSLYKNTLLNMDRLDVSGYLTDYASNSLVTDSAASATSMATGQKTNLGIISQDPSGNKLRTILEIAEKEGKATGIVTTARVTDATPAAFYSHVSNRNNENEIAIQLSNSGVDVVLGGGLQYFVAKDKKTPLGGNSMRNDNRDLIADAQSLGYIFIYNSTGFNLVDPNRTKKLLGLFEDSNMLYELQRINAPDPDPSLAELTNKAISILSKDRKGFFLMVEGGLIDHAGHEKDLPDLVQEVLEFDEAVKIALDYARRNGNTLVIVTGDHETGGLALGANGPGMAPIFALGAHTAVDQPVMASGPGAKNIGKGKMDNTDIFRIIKAELNPFLGVPANKDKYHSTKRNNGK